MKYNNDILTPEEEEYLYRLPDPRRQIQAQSPRQAQPLNQPMMPGDEPPTPYEMNPQLAMYLRGGRASGNPTVSQINAGAMQGIAGGLAQLGTVHGQTPDVSPFTKALAATAQQPTKSDIDPRVVAYLQGGKQPQWRVVGKTQDGKIIYSDGQKEWLGENQSYIKPEKQAAPARAKAPVEKPPSKQEKKDRGEEFAAKTQLDLFDEIEDKYEIAYQQDHAGPIAGKKSAIKRAAGYSVSPEYDFVASSLGKNLAKYIKEQSGTAASDREVARLQKLMPDLDTEPARFATDMQLLRRETMDVINKLRAQNNLPPLPMPERKKTKKPLTPEEKEELEKYRNLEKKGGK
jgi:hypothetical protein